MKLMSVLTRSGEPHFDRTFTPSLPIIWSISLLCLIFLLSVMPHA